MNVQYLVTEWAEERTRIGRKRRRWFDLLVRQMLSMLLMILLQFEFFGIALDVHCAFCYRSRWWWSLIKKFLVSPNRIPTSANL
jgi:hypothetical protein